MTQTPHAGAEHLIALPDRDAAEQIAADLADEGFDEVRVEPNGERWAVHLVDTRLPDTAGGGAYEGLRDRFVALAREHGGVYDEPGDPRPPAG